MDTVRKSPSNEGLYRDQRKANRVQQMPSPNYIFGFRRSQRIHQSILQQYPMLKWSVKPQENIKYLKALQMKGFIVISAKLIGCKKGLARLISLV